MDNGIVSVEGRLNICNGSCWTAELSLTIKLIGIPVANPKIELDCRTTEVCVEVSAVLARAKLCFGVRGTRMCFYIRGEACYWGGRWVCERFDETLFCLAADGQASRTALGGGQGGCDCGK